MKQLTALQQGNIEAFLQEKCTNIETAERIGKDPSTFSREINKRLDVSSNYHA